jgi:hypothetical protein
MPAILSNISLPLSLYVLIMFIKVTYTPRSEAHRAGKINGSFDFKLLKIYAHFHISYYVSINRVL